MGMVRSGGQAGRLLPAGRRHRTFTDVVNPDTNEPLETFPGTL